MTDINRGRRTHPPSSSSFISDRAGARPSPTTFIRHSSSLQRPQSEIWCPGNDHPRLPRVLRTRNYATSPQLNYTIYKASRRWRENGTSYNGSSPSCGSPSTPLDARLPSDFKSRPESLCSHHHYPDSEMSLPSHPLGDQTQGSSTLKNAGFLM